MLRACEELAMTPAGFRDLDRDEQTLFMAYARLREQERRHFVCQVVGQVLEAFSSKKR